MKFTKAILLVATVSAALCLAACGSKLTQDNLQKVHNGMSQDEVKAILGNPTESSSSSGPLGIMNGTTFTYHTDKADVKIIFLNNQVISTEGDFK